MNFAKEFKEFANKGNVLDLAVGVILGTALGKVVTSLVNDILMPPIGKVLGEVNFNDLFINLSPHQRMPNGDRIVSLAQAKAAGVAVIAYGEFITAALDFVIVAVCVFAFVKALRALKQRLLLDWATAPAENRQEKLLTEIRDLPKADHDKLAMDQRPVGIPITVSNNPPGNSGQSPIQSRR